MASQQAGHEVWTDRDRDIVYLRLSGRMDEDELAEAREAIVEAAASMDGEFRIINDLSGLRPQSPEEAEQVKRGQSKLAELGVTDVVRVIDDDTSEVVRMTFDVGSREAGYAGDVARSIEDAEVMLAR